MQTIELSYAVLEPEPMSERERERERPSQADTWDLRPTHPKAQSNQVTCCKSPTELLWPMKICESVALRGLA